MTAVDRALDRRQFAATIADLGFPALPGIEDEAAWHRVLPDASRIRRAGLLRALSSTLVDASEGGRQRHGAWREAGAPQVDRSWVIDHLVLQGDVSFVPVVVDALLYTPHPVRHAATLRVAFVGVGIDSTAFEAAALHVAPDGSQRERCIVLGPQADILVALHEIGHTHHAHPRTPGDAAIAVSSLGEAGLRELARSEGWHHRIDDFVGRQERLADACAASWWLASRDELSLQAV